MGIEGVQEVHKTEQEGNEDLSIDLRSRNTAESKRKKKTGLVSSNDNTAQNSKSSPKKKKKKTKSKVEKKASRGKTPSEVFKFDEIANNKEASALIRDLVKCFTSNSRLSQEEQNLLNRTLYAKTVSVFLTILNKCIEKIFNKVVNTDSFQELLQRNKIVKKSVLCQTDISYENS